MIPLEDVAIFRLWRDAFAGVMDPRFYTIESTEVLLLNGVFKLLHTDSAAVIVEVRTYPTGAKEVHGLIAAGDMADIVSVLIPQALEWGKAQGCIIGSIESREGWGRALKPYGWREHQIRLVKEI